MAEPVRVRIAPSPTGQFHFGLARTALFNYLFAKQKGGQFILRIEDTDVERNVEGSVENIEESLQWLGLNWDEGPYRQSARLEHYQAAIDQLLKTGHAYRCFCTPEELEAERQVQQQAGQPPKYSGKCRQLTPAEVEKKLAAGQPFAVRFKTPDQTVQFKDLVKGPVSFDAQLFGDFVLARRDGRPLYVFAVVIDDFEMKISHVLRGEEHLPNAAKHLLIAEALGLRAPQFGHLPLITNADRSKMSKRKNPVSISEDYQAKGYLPAALINFMALLGWSSGRDQEIFSLQDLIKEFSLERVGTSPSVFDPEKLLWFNGYYIRQRPVGELADLIRPFLSERLVEQIEKRPDFFIEVVRLIQDRLKVLSEAEELSGFFFELPNYPAELLVAKKSTADRAKLALAVAGSALQDETNLHQTAIEPTLRAAAQKNSLKDGELLWTVRVALSGQLASPGVFELIEVLGKTETLARIKQALKKL